MGTNAIPALDLLKHQVNVTRRVVVSRRRSDYFELLAYPPGGFPPPREVESLPDPLRNRQAARPRHALNLPVLGILQNHLKSLRHTVSLSDS